jgi:N-acetylglucosaminyldiphosphoundecaprenol N-acetyl-beta-D-mannosaminyltransferase
VRVDALDLDDAVARLLAAPQRGAGLAVHLCNAHVLALAERDDAYRSLLDRGGLNLADGAPLVVAARWAGARNLRVKTRPRGTSLLLETVQRGTGAGVSHYFYGSTPETGRRLAHNLRARVPGVRLTTESPPFRPLRPDEHDSLVERVRASKADIVWVGLGTPRQQHMVDRLAASLPVTAVGVGAAFEFVAGTKPEAPRWMQASGLEWVFRLVTEPRRLWHRYLVGNVVFVAGVLRHGLPLVAPRSDGANTPPA